MSAGKRSSKHAQKGRSLGRCPDCMQDMWPAERTIVRPIRIDGKWHGVLLHMACDDADRTGI